MSVIFKNHLFAKECCISGLSKPFWSRARSEFFDHTFPRVHKFSITRVCVFLGAFVANPPAPYNIQEWPEPQICPKFVPTIVFRGFLSEGPKFVENLPKKLKTTVLRQFFNFSVNFRQIWLLLNGTPKSNHRDKFWTNLGFGAFLNAVRGRRVRNTFDRASNIFICGVSEFWSHFISASKTFQETHVLYPVHPKFKKIEFTANFGKMWKEKHFFSRV